MARGFSRGARAVKLGDEREGSSRFHLFSPYRAVPPRPTPRTRSGMIYAGQVRPPRRHRRGRILFRCSASLSLSLSQPVSSSGDFRLVWICDEASRRSDGVWRVVSVQRCISSRSIHEEYCTGSGSSRRVTGRQRPCVFAEHPRHQHQRHFPFYTVDTLVSRFSRARALPACRQRGYIHHVFLFLLKLSKPLNLTRGPSRAICTTRADCSRQIAPDNGGSWTETNSRTRSK